MRVIDGELVYSPTDLARFLKSPFATWMDRLVLNDASAAEPDPEDEYLRILAGKGMAHERGVLEALRAEGREVCAIPDDAQAFAETRAAMVRGEEVVYQARLEARPFAGVADFLVLEEGTKGDPRYEVWDAKLARAPRPEFMIQLCAYAEMVAAMTGHRPVHVGFVLGGGDRARFRTDDFFFHYRRLKDAFLDRMAAFDPDRPPLPDARGDHGRWGSYAERVLEDRDHLSRVADIRTSQIRKLEAAGIHTLTALAESELMRIPKLDPGRFEQLRRQAQLQIESRDKTPPAYEIVVPAPEDPQRGLALLPPPSSFDVYFDMEGYPLVEGGLEYLFGATHLVDGEPEFQEFWAFDAAGEKKAFEDFVDWVMTRLRDDPSMHVYHYAPYEPSALKRLMGKYATREEEVDHLLRKHVFVDLYRVVHQGLRVGEPSYSLKNIEHLYREREGEVATAMDSVVYFERWIESGDPPDWRRSELLCAIRDYNEIDCESTWQLAAWLRDRQAEAGIEYLPPRGPGEEHEEKPLEGAALERRRLVERLLRGLEDMDPESEAHRIQEMLAHLIEFHRREDKPVWWSFFERHGMTPDQLVDDPTCIGRASRTGEPEAVRRSKGFRYRFDPDQDTKIHTGKKVYVAGILEKGLDVEAFDDEGELMVVGGPKVLAAFPGNAPPPEASFLLHDHFKSSPIDASIQAVAQAWADGDGLPGCLRNLLLREPPPLAGGADGPLLAEDEDIVAGTQRVIRSLDGATLCIQGPPGTGKTYVGAQAIANLLDCGANVGVVSNSHEAVLNLMGAVAERFDGDLPCLKIGGPGDHEFFETCPSAVHTAGGKAGAAAYTGGLVGGTAWFFANPDMVGRLDTLFVDEAGQVSMANLVGMARSTRNIVLLGDQMQLSQPIQGSHPGSSGQSALEYALGELATVPPEIGIFLAETWRLHPATCRFVSGAVYEDRLRPEPHTVNRVVRLPGAGGAHVPKEAGIVFSAVEHEACTQASDEEVERIVAIVQELVGRERIDRDGKPAGNITLDDILFIAPYNMQVRRLRAALPDGARVASVDKFQGQEAPIVIVSLCTSPGEAGPRGLGFVLDRNRLNVAISRAQSLAIVVGDPRLALSPVSTVADLARQNLLCRLLAEGDSTA